MNLSKKVQFEYEYYTSSYVPEPIPKVVKLIWKVGAVIEECFYIGVLMTGFLGYICWGTMILRFC